MQYNGVTIPLTDYSAQARADNSTGLSRVAPIEPSTRLKQQYSGNSADISVLTKADDSSNCPCPLQLNRLLGSSAAAVRETVQCGSVN
eukprot:3836624-Amphidinium_carterae.1